MLKFGGFQLQKQMLYLLLNLKDKRFLQDYGHFITINLNRLQHEIGVKTKPLINVYKALKQKIKKQEDGVVEGPTMDELVKSVIMSKSMLKQPKESIPMAESLLQSEWEPAQSYFTSTEYHPVIKEEQSEEYEAENEN